MEGINQADRKVQQRIEKFRNKVLDSFFLDITSLGSLEVLTAFCILAWLVEPKLGLEMSKSLALTVAVVFPLKYMISRPRPSGSIGEPAFSPSFPSAHSAQSFSLSVAVGSSIETLLIPLMVLSALISFSRIYLNMHYFSDVAVGATLGLAIGHLVIFI